MDMNPIGDGDLKQIQHNNDNNTVAFISIGNNDRGVINSHTTSVTAIIINEIVQFTSDDIARVHPFCRICVPGDYVTMLAISILHHKCGVFDIRYTRYKL